MFAECIGIDTPQTHLCRVPLTDTRQRRNGRLTDDACGGYVQIVAEYFQCATRQIDVLPSVLFLGLEKGLICRVYQLCRVFFFLLSANSLFAKCPRNSNRQSVWHTIYRRFLVVYKIYVLAFKDVSVYACVRASRSVVYFQKLITFVHILTKTNTCELL